MNMTEKQVPVWILFALPILIMTSAFLAVTHGSNPAVFQIWGLICLAFILSNVGIFLVASYTLIANPASRAFQRYLGTSFCALPLIGIAVSTLSG